MPNTGCRILVAGLVAIFGRAALAAPAPATARAVLPKVEGTISLDGELSEKPWQEAGYIAPFRDAQGRTPSVHAMTVRGFHGEKMLGLGLVCLGTMPDGDVVRVHLTPPTGTVVELTVAADGTVTSTPAEMGWQVAVQSQRAGWTAECVAPLAALAPAALRPRPGDVWKLRLERLPAAHSPSRAAVAVWPGPAPAVPPAPAPTQTYGLVSFGVANLLPNGDAEVDADRDGLADGWRVTRDGAPAPVPAEAGIETEWIVSGKRSLWTRVLGGTVITMPPSLPLRAGALYRLTGFVWMPMRSEVETVGRLVLAETETAVSLAESASYERFEIIFRATTETVMPRLELRGDGGSCYVDASALEMLAMPPVEGAARPGDAPAPTPKEAMPVDRAAPPQ